MNISPPVQKIFLYPCPYCYPAGTITGSACQGHPREMFPLPPLVQPITVSGGHVLSLAPLTEERVRQLIAEAIGQGLKVTYQDSEARLRGIVQERFGDCLAYYKEDFRAIAGEEIQKRVIEKETERVEEYLRRVRDMLDQHWRSMWAQVSDSTITEGPCELETMMRTNVAQFIQDHMDWFAARIREEIGKTIGGLTVLGRPIKEWHDLADELALRDVNSAPTVDAIRVRVSAATQEAIAKGFEARAHLIMGDFDNARAAAYVRGMKLTPAAQCVGLESERPNGKADAPPTEQPDRALSEYERAAIAFALADSNWHADPSADMAKVRDAARQRFLEACKAWPRATR